MLNPFMGEISVMAFNYAPRNWASCNGQLLPINQNMPLFALLGTTYGGNGTTNFALPDLRGRGPVHSMPGLPYGTPSGQETVTLSTAELPTHVHLERARGAEHETTRPGGKTLARGGAYGEPDGTTLHAEAVGSAGGSQPHDNMPPYLTLNFCIALQGVFPSPN